MQSFYTSLEPGRFEATESTIGPWHVSVQHGGPPSALMAREIERVASLGRGFDWRRVTVDFVRPVPVSTVTVRVTPIHAGRKMQLYSAVLEADDKVVARATALATRRIEVQVPDHGVMHARPTRGPDESAPEEASFFSSEIGYHKAVDSRFAVGDFGLGASAAWFNMRVPLVDDEPATPIQRVMITADCVSGTSRVLESDAYSFVNTDLTVHLLRPAVSEWICIDGKSSIGDMGSGLAASLIFDTQGMIGQSLQTLLVDEQP